MSLELHVAIENATDQLQSVLPAYASGKLLQPELPHALGILFRQLGTCRMLLEGVAAPFFTATMQAAGVYLFRLPTLADNEKITSMAACFWDAVAGGYWDAGREIARLSRMTPNLACEHEDDFLYVAYIMQRYFLASHADATASANHVAEQQRRLDRWREVVGNEESLPLALCEALNRRDHEGFREALLNSAQKRENDLTKRQKEGRLTDEHALWARPIWPQGLALLRLAERDGLSVDFECPGVPELLRVEPPFRFDPNAWRSVDFHAQPR